MEVKLHEVQWIKVTIFQCVVSMSFVNSLSHACIVIIVVFFLIPIKDNRESMVIQGNI